jgi:membrane protease YdiL (CAAX protease family)
MRPQAVPRREGRLNTTRIRPFWRGLLFLFDRPEETSYSSPQGYRLLAVFLLLEFVVRPLIRAAVAKSAPAVLPWWQLLEMSLLTVLAWALIKSFCGVPLPQLGLYPWRRWSQTEKFYFPQILLISLAVFLPINWTDLKTLWLRHDLWPIGFCVILTQMIWGFYQELLYRGILQTELVRRLGTAWGIVASNLIFTFGPLHAYHFAIARANPSHLWIFAAIFANGLFFAALYWRSGNLAIVGILHGMGDFFLDGLGQLLRLAR